MGSKDYAFKILPDGKKILATAYWAENQKGETNAVAIAFHGGGFTIGSKDMIPSEQISALNNAGFVVLSADYRLCPQVSLYDGPMQDAKDAYRWCKTEFATLLKEDEDISIDSARVVAIGYSAGGLLALHLGAVPEPPLAILDFYGAKYTKDDFWFTPLPQLQQLPLFPKEHLNKIWDEPTISTTATSLERVAAEKPAGGKTKGMGKPDLSVPRNAWLFDALKRGTHMKEIVKDGDYERVDPAQHFSPMFPPTCFIHGLSDFLIAPRFSIAAHDNLRELGVETSIELLEGQSHGFDSGLEPEDPEFKPVLRGIEFLKYHA